MRIYAIRDTVAQAIVAGAVFTERSDASASRMFADACLDERGLIGKHPGDFELIHLGDLEEDTGKITTDGVFGYPLPRVITTGASMVAARNAAQAQGDIK
ncbi:nonstructural protein [Apis mellifera associated microvirus 11]|nr:nonstructural protein [Apis mellifera associated microvirus 11]AZL82775.1 nonstructural protein [Apis mellifera associated microvirus 11]